MQHLETMSQHYEALQMAGGALAALSMLSACASEHALPQFKPLIGGLDESQVPADAREDLLHAREDFQMVREGKKPVYAVPTGRIPGTHSQVYQGNGYELTLIDNDSANVHLLGPEIVLGSQITHGQPYRYDEIQRLDEAPQY